MNVREALLHSFKISTLPYENASDPLHTPSISKDQRDGSKCPVQTESGGEARGCFVDATRSRAAWRSDASLASAFLRRAHHAKTVSDTVVRRIRMLTADCMNNGLGRC